MSSRDAEPKSKNRYAGLQQIDPDTKKPIDDPLIQSEKNPDARFTHKKAYGQVTIRFPIDWNPLNIIALLYGFLPWLIPIGLTIYFIVTWHFIYIYGPLMSVVLAIINEAILKKIFNEPRPIESANIHKDGTMKPGMPSGHVLNATSIMVWALLEVYFKGPGLEVHSGLTYTWLAVILAVHVPVPWARWYNYDHTLNQCIVSLVLGTLAGIAGFYLRVRFFSGAWKPWLDAMGKTHPNHAPIVTFFTPPWITTSAPTEAAHRSLLLL